MLRQMIRLSAILSSALSLCACATGGPQHEYELAPGRAYNPGLRTALLVPINETDSLPAGLEKGEEVIFELIQTYLNEQGVLIEIPKADDYRRAASDALLAARRKLMSGTATSVARSISYSDMVPGILEGLESGADLVIVPNMAIRNANWGSKTLQWDGVRRRTPGVGAMTMSGTSTAASLHIAIYAEDGTRVLSSYGGLDVIWSINRSQEKSELIPDRLENLRYLSQGVCIAFHPYFGDLPCH